MGKKTITDINVAGKRVLLRCDFNVPLKDGAITDDTRIAEALPTIKYLLAEGARLILCSHLGRPKGEFNSKYTLKPVADRLNEYLGGIVSFATDVIGEDARAKAAALTDGTALLIENLRFHKEEEQNERGFCEKLSELCDVYVNDAFGTAHRAHASTAGIVEYGFVKTAVMGFLIEKELRFLGEAVENPKRPFVAILGGAKVSDKIEVINSLLAKADTLIIGGGMAFTFLAAQGINVGRSLVEEDKKELALSLLKTAAENHVKVLLPVDVRTATHYPQPIDEHMTYKENVVANMPEGEMGLDIGKKTAELFAAAIADAQTIIWNGPMGVFENPAFAFGTTTVAQAVADSPAISIIGGGDSAAAVAALGLAGKITHISTGGGASLEFLGGKALPGIECLNDK